MSRVTAGIMRINQELDKISGLDGIVADKIEMLEKQIKIMVSDILENHSEASIFNYFGSKIDISKLSSSELFTLMTDTQKDDIYRMVWSDYVEEDVRGVLDEREDLTEEERDAIIEDVVNGYVYNGDYDCTLSYWDNINNLIEKS